MSEPVTEELTYCAVHPDRETTLRCNKCGRLMCVQCAVQTPVGYRCRECVRQHEDRFFSATNNDYVIVFAVCAVLGGIGAFVVGLLGGFLLVALLLSAPIGGGIGEAALRLTGRRRGRHSAEIAAGGVVAGGLAYLFVGSGGYLILSVPILLYVAITAGAVYSMYRMRI